MKFEKNQQVEEINGHAFSHTLWTFYTKFKIKKFSCFFVCFFLCVFFCVFFFVCFFLCVFFVCLFCGIDFLYCIFQGMRRSGESERTRLQSDDPCPAVEREWCCSTAIKGWRKSMRYDKSEWGDDTQITWRFGLRMSRVVYYSHNTALTVTDQLKSDRRAIHCKHRDRNLNVQI